MSFRGQFNQWLNKTVFAPVVLFVVVINLILLKAVLTGQYSFLQELNGRAVYDVGGFIEIAAQDLRQLSESDNILDFASGSDRSKISRAADAVQREIEETAKRWEHSGLDEPLVRGVVHNRLSDIFREMLQERSGYVRVIATDSAGGLIGATAKPDKYGYGTEAWWKAVSKSPTGVVRAGTTENPSELTLSLGLRVGAGNTLVGVLHAVIDLNHLAKKVTEAAPSPDEAVFIYTTAPILLRGSSEFFTAAKGHIDAVFEKAHPTKAHRNNYMLVAGRVDSGIKWNQPVSVATIRRSSGPAMAKYQPVVWSVIVSGAFLAGLWFLLHSTGGRKFLDPAVSLIQAGTWAIRKSRQHEDESYEPEAAIPEIFLETPDSGAPVIRDLDGWQRSLRRIMRDEMVEQADEMQRDLEIAHDFQMAYLNRPYPKIPEVHIEGRLRLEFCHRYNPALALGGDFFNIVPLAPDCAGVMIADVMGHGTRSALITAILRTLMSDLIKQGRNARHFLTEMNRQFEGMLRSLPSPLFASAFYFVGDTTARVATYATAGHPSPFHLRRSVGRISQLKVPEPHGAALGIVPGEEYSGGHCRLIPGDVFIFFTDGVYEAPNEDGEEFGLKRVERAIRRLMYKSVKEISDGIIETLQEFVGDEPIPDDICIVCVEVTTTSPESTSPGLTPMLH